MPEDQKPTPGEVTTQSPALDESAVIDVAVAGEEVVEPQSPPPPPPPDEPPVDEEPFQDPDQDGAEGGPEMPFLGHLEELRSRMIQVSIGVFVCFLGAFAFKEDLYHWLAMPLKAAMPPGAKLIYTAPAEAFFTYLKISFLAAVVIASPWIFYQIWRFVAPGLYQRERKAVIPFVIISSGLFITGTVFCYMVVFPFAYQFFMSFATDDITPMLSLSSYLSFSATLLFAFGGIFEMPLVLVFLGRLGLVNAAMLRKQRKYAILLIFVVAAILTPPDAVTQCLMAVPLIVLYEISVLMVAMTEKKKAARQAAEEAEFEK